MVFRESRALVALARGKPYTVAEVGEDVIGLVLGLTESSCSSHRGQMVPAEIIRTQTAQPVILFVEDEILIRLSTADFLRKSGFTVIEAGAAYEALMVLKARSDVTLVLTDLGMPGALDGSGLIRQIRKLYPDVKVIVASAFQSSEPVDATVAKPYSMERVLEVIK